MNARRRVPQILAGCLVLILIPLVVAMAQGRRHLTGTGIGSDIAVPGEPTEPYTPPVRTETRTTVIEIERVEIEPVQPPPAASVAPPESAGAVQTPAVPESPVVTRAEPAPVSVESQTARLPATAGETSLLVLIGVLGLAGAAGLKRIELKSTR